MYVLLHLQSISSRIWLSVSSVIAIFHCTSESIGKLSSCVSPCACVNYLKQCLANTLSTCGTKYAFSRFTAFLSFFASPVVGRTEKVS